MTTRPPRFAEWLITVTAPDADRVAMLGDLEEEFRTLAEERGRATAVRWYARQAVTSIAHNVLRRATSSRPYQIPEPRSARMQSMFTDLRFAWRSLGRRPGLVIAAGVSMAAGISLTAVVFSLLDAAVLRPLPVADPDSMAVMLSRRPSGMNHNFSYPDFADYRAGQRTFVDLAASGPATAVVRGLSGATIVEAELVSGNYFDTLGVRVDAGRSLTEDDLRPGAAPSVVVSRALWREIAGDGVSFDGRAATINGQPFVVAGIAPARFRGIQIGRNVQIWAPVSTQPVLSAAGGRTYWNVRQTSWLTVLGRLKPGVTLGQGAADLNRIEAGLGPSLGREEQRTLVLAPGAQGDSLLPGATAEPLQLLFGAAILVLVVATANGANLLATRASDRQRELAVRLALGAGRLRLVRLLAAEALLIGGASSAAALVATLWLSGGVVSLLPGLTDPAALDVGLSWRLAAFVGGLGLAAMTAASLLPAVRVWRGGTPRTLADAGRAMSAGVGAQRARHALVMAQVALSLSLVIASTLLIRTLVNVRGIDSGLAMNHVALLAVDPESAGYRGVRVRQYFDEALSRLSRIPGVEATGYGRVIPLGSGGSRTSIEIPGYTPAPGEDMEINFNTVSAGYFDALGLRLLSGRLLSDADTEGSPAVAVINETMARRFWAGASPIGRTFPFGGADGPLVQIVGVVRDVKYRTIREEPRPSFYLSVAQSSNPRGGVLHVRTMGVPGPLLPVLRKALMEFDSAVPIRFARTLREQRDINTANEGLAVTIGIVLAGVALVLAAIGLFAAMSASVVRRTREIGVRVALGARRTEIVGMILRHSLRLVTIGSALGILLAYWLSGFIEQRLYGVRAHDPVSFAAGVVILTVVALGAAWAPARRAAGVDPIQALRVE